VHERYLKGLTNSAQIRPKTSSETLEISDEEPPGGSDRGVLEGKLPVDNWFPVDDQK